MKKIILLLFFLLVIFSVQQYFLYRNTSQKYQIPNKFHTNYFDKYANVFCVRPNNYELPSELLGSSLIINSKANSVNPVQNCVVYKYDFLKNESKGLNGYFMFDSLNSTPNNLTIIIDNLYKGNSDLTTSILILHELSKAYEHLKSIEIKQPLSCLDEEILAYKTQAQFIRFLNPTEKLNLFLDVFSKSIQDSSYEIIRQVISSELKAEIFCFYDQTCVEKNSLQKIETILKNNALHSEYCPDNLPN